MSDPRLSIIPAGAVLDPRIKPRDLQVLCVFGRHIDKKGWCRRSQVQMAKEMGCARSTVQGSIDRLIAAGWLQKRVLSTPHQAGERDSAHEYRVVLDTPDDTQDVVDTPADISAPLPTQDRHPLPTHGSAPINDPSLTKSSLRSERATDRFDDFEKAYPKPMGSDRSRAKRAFGKLSDVDQLKAISAAQRLSSEREADRMARGESRERSQRYTPNASRWLAERCWDVAEHPPPQTDLVIIRPGQPDFEAVERYRGRKISLGMSGTATVRQSEIDAARERVSA